MIFQQSNQKNNFSLGQIIPLGLGIIAVLNLLMAVVSRHSISTITKSIYLVNQAQTVKADLGLLKKQILDAETGQRGFLYTGDNTYLEPYEQAVAEIDKTFQNLSELIVDEGQLLILNNIKVLTEKKLKELAETIRLKTQGKEAEAKKIVLSNFGKQVMNDIRIEIEQMEFYEQKNINERQTIVDQSEAQAKTITTVAALAIFLVICLMVWFILRQVIKPIEHVSLAISSSSTQIATTVEEQERIANQQAALVNQTTATMDELRASSRQAANQAEAASMNAQRLIILSIGQNTTENTTWDNDSNLKEKSRQIAKKVMGLSEKLTQIDRIAGVVSQLANQTNMLALNAAVEAVRAGENGKGFGVIATEIRKLADQSGKYGDQINALTADIQNATESTVNVTQEGTEVVDKMVESINEMTLNIKQIYLSANQQAEAIQQTVQAMTTINQGAAETASGIGQTRTSTKQLNEAAHTLKSLI